MGRPPRHRACGAAIQPWPSSRRSRTARRAEITPPLPARARAAGSTGHPRAGAPALPRGALAGLPQQARAGIRGALRAGAGYLAGQLARAARGEHIAFAAGARRIAPLGRLPDGAARDDWREGGRHRRRPGRRAGLPPRLVPGGCVAVVPPGRAGLLTGRRGEPTVASGKTGRAGAADRDV